MAILDSNEGLNGWQALAIGGLAIAGLAGYGGARRMMSKSGAAIASAGAGGIGRFFGSSYLPAAKNAMLGGSSLGRMGNLLRGWATAADRPGSRLATGAGRIGALGAAAYGASYMNPFINDEGTLSGTLKTAAMGLGGAAAFGKLGGWRGAKNAWGRVSGMGLKGVASKIGGGIGAARNMAEEAYGEFAGKAGI